MENTVAFFFEEFMHVDEEEIDLEQLRKEQKHIVASTKDKQIMINDDVYDNIEKPSRKNEKRSSNKNIKAPSKPKRKYRYLILQFKIMKNH